MSIEQQKGIISLIPKKDKDSTFLNIGPNGPIGSAFILTIDMFTTGHKIPVKTNRVVRFLYQEVKSYRTYGDIRL